MTYLVRISIRAIADLKAGRGSRVDALTRRSRAACAAGGPVPAAVTQRDRDSSRSWSCRVSGPAVLEQPDVHGV
jgi:hypothetical protein